MDPRGWGTMPLTSRSQRRHSHQGITGKFLLCSQIKHPEIEVSLLENTFKGLFQLLNTPQTHHEGKKGCSRSRLPLALQPGPCNPLSRAPPKSETQSVVKGHTEVEIVELLMRNTSFTLVIHILLQPGTNKLLLPLFCFLHTSMSRSLLAGSPT